MGSQLHLTAIKHRAGLFDQTGDWPFGRSRFALAAAGADEVGGAQRSSAVMIWRRWNCIWATSGLSAASVSTGRWILTLPRLGRSD